MIGQKDMEMVDLKSLYRRMKSELDAAVLSAMAGANYINGPEVSLLAANLSKYLDVDYVVPCGNGTDALQMALMALDLKPGDEVITAAFSFVASAEVIALLGLKPVFVDVDPVTFNISSDLLEAAITPRTRVVLPVHLFGQAAAMNDIMRVADKHHLYVVEDVAQSLGADYHYRGGKKKLGTIGHIGCTSFFPTKNLGGCGDGGACFTNDERLAAKMEMLAGHGSSKRYYHDVVGFNSRLDTLQAAILNVKLNYLDEFLSIRQKIATRYNAGLAGLQDLAVPGMDALATHTYNQYTIRVFNGGRDRLQKYLKEQGVSSRVYYPVPLHHQKAFENWADGISRPVAENLCGDVLSLPVHTEMSLQDVDRVVRTIKEFYKS
ncbi:DegT/DnrJ/EryC1/StrS family aminotransferase [Geofilum sp. OHC36d9]|uniref:DegT/DnrJ/EryC1/StrS family aminotransferase n=1 Tax=Geofilum sp. OHC36d9 TaxID=3458413 RepID=UPI0040344A1B